jgi:hypothetical protein
VRDFRTAVQASPKPLNKYFIIHQKIELSTIPLKLLNDLETTYKVSRDYLHWQVVIVEHQQQLLYLPWHLGNGNNI